MRQHRYCAESCGSENQEGAQIKVANDPAKEKDTEGNVEDSACDDPRTVSRMRDRAYEVEQTIGEHEEADPCGQDETRCSVRSGHDQQSDEDGNGQSHGVDREEEVLGDSARDEAVEPRDEAGSLLQDVEDEDEGSGEDELSERHYSEPRHKWRANVRVIRGCLARNPSTHHLQQPHPLSVSAPCQLCMLLRIWLARGRPPIPRPDSPIPGEVGTGTRD